MTKADLLAGSPVTFVGVPATLPLSDIVARLNELQADVVFGYASMLARLAAEQRAGRLAIAPTGITSTSEMLLPTDRLRSRLRDVLARAGLPRPPGHRRRRLDPCAASAGGKLQRALPQP